MISVISMSILRMNCILYIVDNGDMTVSIMRVMYGGRDIDAQLDKHTKYDE